MYAGEYGSEWMQSQRLSSRTAGVHRRLPAPPEGAVQAIKVRKIDIDIDIGERAYQSREQRA